MNLLFVLSILFMGPGSEIPSSVSMIQSDSIPCNCCTQDYMDFDFWIGEWVVYDTAGTKVGVNSIKLKEGHCLLEENWTGGTGFTGTSYNYFNKQDSSWHQIWIDMTGGVLNMKGGIINGSMVMQTEAQTSEKGVRYFNRISWIPKQDGSVHQIWKVLKEEDESLLQLAFYGIYRKE